MLSRLRLALVVICAATLPLAAVRAPAAVAASTANGGPSGGTAAGGGPAVFAAGAASGGAAVFPAAAAGELTSELRSAWRITRGNGVLVAVLSSGVASVTGLAGKLITGPDYAPMTKPDMTDGTVLASAIAGSGSAGISPIGSIGSIGRAPGARVMSVRIEDTQVAGAASRFHADGTWQGLMARAIRYAVGHGAQVIVTDFGDSQTSSALAAAVAYAISRNVPIVSSGYFRTAYSAAAYPDDLPGVIAARGVPIPGLSAAPTAPLSYQPFEDALVSEPENQLFATGPGDTPYVVFGDYSAVAWLAGTVILIKAVYPGMSPAMIARALALSASYAPAGGYDSRVGFGLINPIGALRAAARLRNVPATAIAGPGVVAASARFGSGPPPGVIDAVRYSPVRLAGYSGAIALGLILLLTAALLRRRWCRAGH